MNNNLYWPIFKNLEKEVINLSNEVHFDDDQLNIYSVKITELLIRTVVEVESISKELYFTNGGTKADTNELFFDTDCIDLLETKLLLSQKKAFVTSPNFYFQKEENQILTPLKKANKRGSSSSDWLKAYQAVKHNRAKSLKKGSLKHLIRALAGLYILNLYYKDISYDLEKDGEGTSFDTNVGAEIFSIKVHINQSVSIDNSYTINSDFDECVYILKPTDETREIVQNSLKELNIKIQERIEANLASEIQNRFTDSSISSQNEFESKIKDLVNGIKNDYSTQVANENAHLLKRSFDELRYEAILNKKQF